MVALYGTGGHASVVLDTLWALAESIEAVFDDDAHVSVFGGFPVQPGVLCDERGAFIPPVSPLIICVGHNASRSIIVAALSVTFGRAVHPTAMISGDVRLGVGSVAFHRAVVLNESVVGRHVILNTGAVVGAGCVLEDFTHISPAACVGDGVYVGKGSHVGAAATVAAGVRIGQWCTIGAGTRVQSDVPDGVTLVGNPSRIIRQRPTPVT